MTLLTRVRSWLKGADAPTESDSSRDGVLSYAMEWHALGIGAGAGYAAVAHGNDRIAGAVIAAALTAKRGRDRLVHDAYVNVHAEPWYAVGGLAIGGAVGALDRGLGALGGVLP